MPKKAKPAWQSILEDYPLGKEPPPDPESDPETDSSLPGLLNQRFDLKQHKFWEQIRDAKLDALALREGMWKSNGIDWKGLALALALKHETGFKNTRKRGRPSELNQDAARNARRALLSYVQERAKAKSGSGQVTSILRHLAMNKARLGTIDPYYKHAKHQSLPKLKKDYQQAKRDSEQYMLKLAELLMQSPSALLIGPTGPLSAPPSSEIHGAGTLALTKKMLPRIFQWPDTK